MRLIVLRPSGPSPGTHTATAMMSWPTSTKAHRSYRICIPPVNRPGESGDSLI
ncbi:Uncharacterised protein [Mycobacterium tuberculosis]|uniref:Uncharacterized protein n=1 Tax=Mycobacterium tuberculosis TaxID=1773 RepID=A0A916PDW3_MYCTX|nr:Uncharacterised protein [Mycobacterium tuberculosis]